MVPVRMGHDCCYSLWQSQCCSLIGSACDAHDARPVPLRIGGVQWRDMLVLRGAPWEGSHDTPCLSDVGVHDVLVRHRILLASTKVKGHSPAASEDVCLVDVGGSKPKLISRHARFGTSAGASACRGPSSFCECDLVCLYNIRGYHRTESSFASMNVFKNLFKEVRWSSPMDFQGIMSSRPIAPAIIAVAV